LANLLDNAVRYGHGHPIQVRLQRLGDEALVEVRDSGIGIEREELARIFDRFERGGKSRRAGGLGLGLYLTEQIVRAHGGQVHVRSDQEQGTQFTLTLPLVAVSAQRKDISPPPAERTPLAGRVLVVEDDADVRTAIADVLTEEGYEVSLASNGQEALESLRSGSAPVMILLDLWMPVLDGWQFREAQLADPAIAGIPVIIMSGTVPEPPLPGIRETLKKPIRIQQLLSAVTEVASEAKPAG
jgi:CheY-like chemotaxis protein